MWKTDIYLLIIPWQPNSHLSEILFGFHSTSESTNRSHLPLSIPLSISISLARPKTASIHHSTTFYQLSEIYQSNNMSYPFIQIRHIAFKDEDEEKQGIAILPSGPCWIATYKNDESWGFEKREMMPEQWSTVSEGRIPRPEYLPKVESWIEAFESHEAESPYSHRPMNAEVFVADSMTYLSENSLVASADNLMWWAKYDAGYPSADGKTGDTSKIIWRCVCDIQTACTCVSILHKLLTKHRHLSAHHAEQLSTDEHADVFVSTASYFDASRIVVNVATADLPSLEQDRIYDPGSQLNFFFLNIPRSHFFFYFCLYPRSDCFPLDFLSFFLSVFVFFIFLFKLK